MNVYLDIDGVLLANEDSATNYADEFLQDVQHILILPTG